MSHAVSLINAFAAAWADALFRACWQGGLGIALAWLLCRLWPALPAGPRCWLWRLAYAKLLLGLVWLPPLALPLLPAPRPAAPSPVVQATTPPVQAIPDDAPRMATEPAPAFASPSAPLAAVPPPPATMSTPPPRPTLPTVQTWLLAVWLLGVHAGLGRVWFAWRRACALSRASRPLTDAALQADAADLSRRLGLRRVPPLRVAESLASPLLLGLGRPAILLPAFVVSGSPRSELRLMLAHELAHLARRDLWWNAVPLLAQRLFFFHPLLWLAGHEWSLAQEIACDALAVETTGTPPSAYGRMLLGIATRRRPSAAPLFPTLAVAAPRHTLRRRLHAMQHIGTASRPRLILAAALTTLLAVGGLLPWRVVAQSGAASAPPGVIQKEEAHQMNERAYYAPLNAQTDRQLAQLDALFPRILERLSVGQQRISRLEIARHIAEIAKDQQHLQMLEQHRADYLTTHPNRLSDAQIALVQKANWDKAALGRSIRYVPWAQGIEHKLQAHLETAQDTHSRRSWQRQIAAIEQRRQAAESQTRELGTAIVREEDVVAVIPADQRARVAKLYDYDAEISGYRSISLMAKQARVSVLQQLFVLAGRPYPPHHNQGVTTKMSLPLPEAKTASFNAVALGGPPPLRLAQLGASLSTPLAVTEKEETVRGKVAAEFAARNAQLDAQLAATLKTLSPEQQKKAEASIAFLNAGDAKTQQHIQMLEQHRAGYLVEHPNRLSDAQIALVQKFNWDKLDPYRIDEGIRWEQSIKRKLQAHIDSSHDARSRQGWQRQIAAIEQRRQAAEKQIHELGPAIAREEAEVATIPADQRARVTKLRSYDSEISAYKNIALMDKQMRIAILLQQIAGRLHGGRHDQGAKTGTSLAPFGQVGMNETQPSHTTGQSILVISRQNTAPNTELLHLPFQMLAPPARPNPLFNVNWRLADLARRLSDLRRGSSLELALKRIAILGGREDGGLQTIPATRYYFSPGIIVEIPVKEGAVTGPLRIHPGGFSCD